MTRGDELRLADIADACREVAAIVDRGRDSFATDPVSIRAVERLLEIIGEAANALSEVSRHRYPEVNWRDLTRLRILLAHHYHRVDPAQLWVMASVEVPLLATGIEAEGS